MTIHQTKGLSVGISRAQHKSYPFQICSPTFLICLQANKTLKEGDQSIKMSQAVWVEEDVRVYPQTTIRIVCNTRMRTDQGKMFLIEAWAPRIIRKNFKISNFHPVIRARLICRLVAAAMLAYCS